jgi:hypothetical protein
MPEPCKKIYSRDYDPTLPGWNPKNFDAIEVHGVADLGPDEQGSTICEMNDENPQFYAVYLHLAAGGVDCVGDFSDFADAEQYAGELCATYRWPIVYISEPTSPVPPLTRPSVSLRLRLALLFLAWTTVCLLGQFITHIRWLSVAAALLAIVAVLILTRPAKA